MSRDAVHHVSVRWVDEGRKAADGDKLLQLWRGIRRGAARISAPSAEHTASSMADKDQDVWIKVPAVARVRCRGMGFGVGLPCHSLRQMGALAIRWRA